MNARKAFIGITGSFQEAITAFEGALRGMVVAGPLAGVPIELILRPEEYLFGGEKALLEVIDRYV